MLSSGAARSRPVPRIPAELPQPGRAASFPAALAELRPDPHPCNSSCLPTDERSLFPFPSLRGAGPGCPQGPRCPRGSRVRGWAQLLPGLPPVRVPPGPAHLEWKRRAEEPGLSPPEPGGLGLAMGAGPAAGSGQRSMAAPGSDAPSKETRGQAPPPADVTRPRLPRSLPARRVPLRDGESGPGLGIPRARRPPGGRTRPVPTGTSPVLPQRSPGAGTTPARYRPGEAEEQR